MLRKIPGKPEYDITLDETLVHIGGNGVGRFVPNINMSKFDDEAWLNINHADVVTGQTPTTRGDIGSVELPVGNNTHRMYETPGGNLEYEIELAARPPTDIIEYDIDFPAGLTFSYQDTLENDWLRNGPRSGQSLSEYLNDNSRPDNVIGSYAVFFNKRHNKYKNGKLCHIYRPKLIDNNGVEIWAELNINPATKKMTITMDGAWLDSAAYPVIVDPELGYNTKGASNYGSSSTYAMASAATSDVSGGDMSDINAYVINDDGSNTWGYLLCVYDDSGGEPDTQVTAEVEVTAVPTFDGLKTISYTGTLSASTDYWVCIQNEDGTADTWYDTLSEGSWWGIPSGYGLPATFPAGGFFQDFQFSVWADYDAGVENTAVPGKGTLAIAGNQPTVTATVALDDFNRADGTVGANYTAEIGTIFDVVSNRVSPPNSSATRYLTSRNGTWADDQRASLRFVSGNNSGTWHGPAVRCDGNNYYALNYHNSELEIWRMVAGSTSLLSGGAQALTPGDEYELEIIGTQLRAYVNGVEFAAIAITDSNLASGNPGFHCYWNTTRPELDDFNAEDIGGGNTASPGAGVIVLAGNQATTFITKNVDANKGLLVIAGDVAVVEMIAAGTANTAIAGRGTVVFAGDQATVQGFYERTAIAGKGTLAFMGKQSIAASQGISEAQPTVGRVVFAGKQATPQSLNEQTAIVSRGTIVVSGNQPSALITKTTAAISGLIVVKGLQPVVSAVQEPTASPGIGRIVFKGKPSTFVQTAAITPGMGRVIFRGLTGGVGNTSKPTTGILEFVGNRATVDQLLWIPVAQPGDNWSRRADPAGEWTRKSDSSDNWSKQ